MTQAVKNIDPIFDDGKWSSYQEKLDDQSAREAWVDQKAEDLVEQALTHTQTNNDLYSYFVEQVVNSDDETVEAWDKANIDLLTCSSKTFIEKQEVVISIIRDFARQMAEGIYDCKKGNPQRLNLKSYLAGYGFQYELEASKDAITL